MSYAHDGKEVELFSLITGEFTLFELNTDQYFFGGTPPEWSEEVREAQSLKKQGQYLAAAQIITGLMLDAKACYTELTDILYEVEACSGLLVCAYQRLQHMIGMLEIAGLTSAVPTYQMKLDQLVAAVASEDSLLEHLRWRSGSHFDDYNPDYVLPKPYPELVAGLERFMASN